MPDILDLAFVATFTAGLTLFQYAVGWPRMRRLIASNAPGTRLRVYRTAIVAQWVAAIIGWLLLRRHNGGPRTVYLVAPTGLGLAGGTVIILFTAALLVRQYRIFARLSGERLDAFRARLGGVGPILPHDGRELRWFLLVALTAGLCEEFLYRGYAVWVLGSWLGFAWAGVVLTILFGLGHGYQGRAGAIRSTVLGAIFVLMIVLTRSIIPGIVLHILIDVGGGLAGWAAFRERPASA